MSAGKLALAIATILLAGSALAARVAPARMTRLALWAERRRCRLHLAHARVDGFDMPYLQGGQGEPLLLLHGFAGDKDNFTRVARYLTRHYRVL
ncbi:MAG TPA: alpha/beta hydrolase, partial [Telluria sp.]|nr:alpha/beta hydrolase [Telluria sp.]